MMMPLWKRITILVVCFGAVLLASPNLFSDEQLEAWYPKSLPTDKINLGLDLRGGSHLLYRLDIESYFSGVYETIQDDLRVLMREANIGYRQLDATETGVGFDLTDLASKDQVEDIIDDIDPALSIIENNGTYLLQYDEMTRAEKKQELMEQSIEIINRRINETGTKEPTVQRQGEARILVQVPGVEDPEQLKDIIGKTAKMNFHLVNESVTEQQLLRGIVPADTRIIPEQRNGGIGRVPIYRRVELSGELLTGANPTFDKGQPVVAFSFNTAGAQKFAKITQENTGKRFAVVLDGKAITAPVINSPILNGNGIIEGNFTIESANELAILLRAGALPAPMEIIEERTVGASLGADSIAAGEQAVVIAFIAIMLFMLFYYRALGFLSDIALLMNVVLIVAALSLFQATLTLPGIAGIVLTMGMAVDANTLIFERIREELRRGKRMVVAIDHGYNSAMQTIMDANITTLIAAFILFYFGSGTIKGFAVTLSIGILSSMFTAIMLTRFLIWQWVRWGKPNRLPLKT